MRFPTVLAALAASFALTACGGAGAGGQMAGPPDWFLRDHERQQAAAARAGADGMIFAVPTPQAPNVYRERVAFLIEECWIGKEAGWRLQRGPGGRDLSLIEQRGKDAPQNLAVRFSVAKGEGPGLLVHASGALATDAQRDRLRRSLERAATFNPSAPHCPNFADTPAAPEAGDA